MHSGKYLSMFWSTTAISVVVCLFYQFLTSEDVSKHRHPACQAHTRNSMNLNFSGLSQTYKLTLLGGFKFPRKCEFHMNDCKSNVMYSPAASAAELSLGVLKRKAGMYIRITHGIKLEWIFPYFGEEKCWLGHPRSLGSPESSTEHYCDARSGSTCYCSVWRGN